ncbi:cupin domain-containing protein [Siminovitchia sp. FSL H7-0308]|jgi:hypothetical protein|uniref:Cupin n=1 Tax=Siminovitchia thermophila TaxID=1245522 RepID=A0ABS2R877_9BACI|nr:cupin domain-containing protein [Siminovitchia thermophila]MBM7715048.1 hypothetical protein [Siminovitchia thermophila]
MGRQELEFTTYEAFPRKQIEGKVKGLWERILSKDSERELVRVLEFEPGVDTSPNGIQYHEYWEHIYIIEGSVIDLTLRKEFTKGMAASRPPGMPHGPWKSPNGCIMFEVRHK